MIKRGVLVCTLLIILLVISGCDDKLAEPSVEEEVLQEKQVSVTIILEQKPTVEILNSLEKEGLKVESIQDKVIIGKVGESKVEELKKKEEVISVEEKKVIQNQQMGMEQIEQQIDALRSMRDITVGPYVAPEVEEGFKINNVMELCMRFRIRDGDEMYAQYIEEIESTLKEEQFDSTKAGGIAFCTKVSRSGFDYLKNYPPLLEIDIRRMAGSPVIATINGTRYWYYGNNDTTVKIE